MDLFLTIVDTGEEKVTQTEFEPVGKHNSIWDCLILLAV
jgi:hypothetical protein